MAKRKRNGARVAAAPQPVRLMKRYTMPRDCRADCTTIIMRELDGNDELEAAIWADKNANSALSESVKAIFAAEQRESVRLSIVQVDDRAVNVDGIPFTDMDGWSLKTLRCLREFFADLNGVELDELKNAVEGAQLITATTAPASIHHEDEEDDDDPRIAE